MSTPMRKARERLNISQSELARRVNCSASTVLRIESGEIWPSFHLLRSLAEELKMPVARILYPNNPEVR